MRSPRCSYSSSSRTNHYSGQPASRDRRKATGSRFAPRRRRRRSRTVLQTARGIPQVAIADDVVAVEHAPSLITAQRHGHALRHAGANHVSDGCAPQVMRDAAWTPRLDPGAAPGMVEAAGRDRVSSEKRDISGLRRSVVKKHMLDDHVLLTLDSVGRLPLIRQQLLQLRSQVENTTFHVLRRSRIQSNLAGLQIDLPPLQWQDLAVDPPAGNVREGYDRTPRFREIRQDGPTAQSIGPVRWASSPSP